MPKPIWRARGVTTLRRSCAWPWARRVARSAILLAPTLACGTERFTSAAPVDGSEAYWELALNHHAVTLSRQTQYDTLTLIATPRTMTGQPIGGLPVPVYVSSDPTKVVVTPDGVLHAVDVGSQPVLVIATLTAENVKHVDTVRVRVLDVADPPVLTTFAIQRPVPPDSAKRAIDFFGWRPLQLVIDATDAQGAAINDVMAAFRSSNPNVASVDPATGVITPNWPGEVILRASATVFGVAKADSMAYRIGAPILPVIFVKTSPSGVGRIPDFPTITVGVGALVVWRGYFGDSLGFTVDFDGTDRTSIAPATAFGEREAAHLAVFCGFFAWECENSGSIVTDPPAVRGAARVFAAPGVYNYRCTSCGNVGRVVVIDEKSQ